MISAKVIADSTANGIRLTTLELKFHRFILPEFNTHRMFSRSASSSRAIPVETTIKQVLENPAMPIHWGKNQAGMQSHEETNASVVMDWDYYNDCEYIGTREEAWIEASQNAVAKARAFNCAGYHKQIVNRLLEPFQYIKVIVTATEWDNFFKLRLHKDAQPEMMLLAKHMKEAMDASLPKLLKPGEWHAPYYYGSFTDEKGNPDVETALKLSVARCARVSYLNHDNSTPDIQKDIALADRLLADGHMSPFEHIATPMEHTKQKDYEYCFPQESGITHMDKNYNFWSGNFRGFRQYRQLLGSVKDDTV